MPMQTGRLHCRVGSQIYCGLDADLQFKSLCFVPISYILHLPKAMRHKTHACAPPPRMAT